jgi:hypothetical protein
MEGTQIRVSRHLERAFFLYFLRNVGGEPVRWHGYHGAASVPPSTTASASCNASKWYSISFACGFGVKRDIVTQSDVSPWFSDGIFSKRWELQPPRCCRVRALVYFGLIQDEFVSTLRGDQGPPLIVLFKGLPTGSFKQHRNANHRQRNDGNSELGSVERS